MRPSDTEILILKCLELMPEIVCSEEFLLLDQKRFIPEALGYSDDPFRRIMQYYSILKSDLGQWLEDRVVAKEIFRRYGWNCRCCDTILPFYPVFAGDLAAYSDANPGLNRSVYDSFGPDTKRWRCALYGQAENGELKVCGRGGLRECGRRTFAKDYLEKGNLQGFILDEYYFKDGSHADRKELAGLCHCAANFMPSPPPAGEEIPFFAAKEMLSGVRGFLNLMADQVQSCVDRGVGITCGADSGRTAGIDVLREWHQWLVSHNKDYCLEDYYLVEERDGEKRIRGVPLFDGQSFENALPDRGDARAINQCVSAMIGAIRSRARRMRLLHTK